jgi:hypothetical protein
LTGHPETEIRFQKLMELPTVDTIEFDNIRWKSMVKIQPHRGCFHNSLDICITNVRRWIVACYMACTVGLTALLLCNFCSSDRVLDLKSLAIQNQFAEG